MQRTANQIIASVQAYRFPMLTSAEALEYMNRVYGDIQLFWPQIARLNTAESVAFSIGDREKDITNAMNQIELAIWTSAGQSTRLQGTTYESLLRGFEKPTDGMFVISANGTPSQFYIKNDPTGKQRVGFNVPPATAGTLTLYGSALDGGISGTELMVNLFNDGVFIEGVSHYYALSRGRANAAVFKTMYDAEMLKVQHWHRTIIEENQSVIENVRTK